MVHIVILIVIRIEILSRIGRPVKDVEMRNVTARGLAGFCRPQLTITKAVEEHPNLCQSNNDCIKKGTGSLCAYYPNSELQHGWCFTSNVEPEQYFEVLTNPTMNNFLKNISYYNGKGFLKMPVEIAT